MELLLLIPLALLFLWALPIYLIIRSDRVESMEKLVWVIAVVFVSWFAWILFALIAPVMDGTRRA